MVDHFTLAGLIADLGSDAELSACIPASAILPKAKDCQIEPPYLMVEIDGPGPDYDHDAIIHQGYLVSVQLVRRRKSCTHCGQDLPLQDDLPGKVMEAMKRFLQAPRGWRQARANCKGAIDYVYAGKGVGCHHSLTLTFAVDFTLSLPKKVG